VALVCGPYASNLDEFARLQQVADVRLVAEHGTLDGAQLVILPGSKHATADLAWLRATGLADAVVTAAQSGVPILGICGGLQMMGERIEDLYGVEDEAGGLGLLPIVTTYARDKRTARTDTRLPRLPEPWGWLSGRTVRGYEIRHGHSRSVDPTTTVNALPDGLGFASGNVLGVYLHGLLEDPAILIGLTGEHAAPLDDAFEHLADAIDAAIDEDWLARQIFR
jgi:adenosylcobyric acid synthase